MIDLTDEMRAAIDGALAEGTPITVASATADGRPDIAFKGSVMVFDREHLAFWERARAQTLRNLQENPQICLLYRSPTRAVAWKFFGVAAVLTDGPVRTEIMDRTIEAELNRDPERKGAGILIRVDRVVQGPNVLMQREQ